MAEMGRKIKPASEVKFMKFMVSRRFVSFGPAAESASSRPSPRKPRPPPLVRALSRIGSGVGGGAGERRKWRESHLEWRGAPAQMGSEVSISASQAFPRPCTSSSAVAIWQAGTRSDG